MFVLSISCVLAYITRLNDERRKGKSLKVTNNLMTLTHSCFLGTQGLEARIKPRPSLNEDMEVRKASDLLAKVKALEICPRLPSFLPIAVSLSYYGYEHEADLLLQ